MPQWPQMTAVKISSSIVSVGSCLPHKVVRTIDIEKSLQFEKKLGLPHGILEKLTGCIEHREADPDVNASDLAAAAGQQAITRADIKAKDLDLLIFCACSQDITEPATANIIQEKMGATNAHVLDVKNACNAFINGIDIADSMIRTGKIETVLICSGEVLSRYVDMDIETREDLQIRAAGLTLGDGGGAVVLGKSIEEKTGVQGSCFTSDGNHWRLATVTAGGTMYPRAPVDPHLTYFHSQSEKIIALARARVPIVIRRLLKGIGWRPADVDLVVPHQVTTRIVKDISRAVGIEFKKNIITLDRYGNTAAASIPIALNHAFEARRLIPGTKILLVGGAAGFSAGAIALAW
jgi:3-oxoacyl-(acyl-carrier-protein) synthase III